MYHLETKVFLMTTEILSSKVSLGYLNMKVLYYKKEDVIWIHTVTFVSWLYVHILPYYRICNVILLLLFINIFYIYTGINKLEFGPSLTHFAFHIVVACWDILFTTEVLVNILEKFGKFQKSTYWMVLPRSAGCYFEDVEDDLEKVDFIKVHLEGQNKGWNCSSNLAQECHPLDLCCKGEKQKERQKNSDTSWNKREILSFSQREDTNR